MFLHPWVILKGIQISWRMKKYFGRGTWRKFWKGMTWPGEASEKVPSVREKSPDSERDFLFSELLHGNLHTRQGFGFRAMIWEGTIWKGILWFSSGWILPKNTSVWTESDIPFASQIHLNMSGTITKVTCKLQSCRLKHASNGSVSPLSSTITGAFMLHAALN